MLVTSLNELWDDLRVASCRGANTYRLQDLIRMTNYAPEDMAGRTMLSERSMLKTTRITTRIW